MSNLFCKKYLPLEIFGNFSVHLSLVPPLMTYLIFYNSIPKTLVYHMTQKYLWLIFDLRM